VRVPGFRITGSSVIFVGGDNVVVAILPWLGLMMKPDGSTVTVPDPSAKPEGLPFDAMVEVALMVAEPVAPAPPPRGCPCT
jgi:hypothetical protein